MDFKLDTRQLRGGRRLLRVVCQALCIVVLLINVHATAAESPGSILSKAVLSEDLDEQTRLLQNLAEAGDPVVQRALIAWRQSELFIHEADRIPFLLETQPDTNGKARGIRLDNGELVKDTNGQAIAFVVAELTAAETSSKLRKAIKSTLDVFALSNPNRKIRRDAAIKVGQEQNADNIAYLEARLKKERDRDTRKVLREAILVTQLADAASEVRVNAIQELGRMRSVNGLSFLEEIEKRSIAEAGANGEAGGSTVKMPVLREEEATVRALRQIRDYMWYGNLVGTAFRGFSLAAVLLVIALGLAITFGLMGVINMAHGEVMMVGAYTAYVTQNFFSRWFGAAGIGFDTYFIAALALSFVVAGAVGLALERGIIRFLYKRPLESLLATWGVSLVLQQLFRHCFGAANVQVVSPSWLSGSFVVNDVLFAYNRLFVIAFAILIVLVTYLLLTRTSLGLQIRAVMQNRAMASCMGVRTERVNMLTFAFGSGLAGMAGACLSQIGNVGPSLGQSHIVDSFMVVVLGGVGNLVGTVFAAIGVGVTDQILQPWLGAVMGKITVLAAIILFLQWRPAGIFAARTRSLEG